MTQQTQIDHELDVVRKLMAARRANVTDIRRSVNDHADGDVLVTLDGGATLEVEVGRIMDQETQARETRATRIQDQLLREYCAASRAKGQSPPGIHVAVDFSENAGAKVRKRVIDAALRFASRQPRPMDWTPIAPLPNGVSRLEMKFSRVGAKAFHVPKCGAFSPALGELVEAKSAEPYAKKGTVTLLAVVPTIQPWMRGPWLDFAVEHLRERLADSPAPFKEIVGLDETTGQILFTIP